MIIVSCRGELEWLRLELAYCYRGSREPEDSPSELEERLRIELALRLYEKGIAGLGQARQIAGLSKWDFLELLAKEGIPIHYGEEELRENLEVAKKFARRTRKQ